LHYDANGNTTLYIDNSYNSNASKIKIRTKTSATAFEAITVTGDGSVAMGNGLSVTNTVGVGAATPSASGAGITFPATASDSTSANTLDDYEEGTWTPALAFGGGSTGITYNERSGSYVKIGRVVYAWMSIYLTNKGSSTGSAQINGLPFTGTNGYYNEQTASLSDVNYITFGGILMARVGGSTLTGGINCFQLYQVTSGNAFTEVTNTGFANNTSISMFVSYTTNA
jgi:hypothetical protein